MQIHLEQKDDATQMLLCLLPFCVRVKSWLSASKHPSILLSLVTMENLDTILLIGYIHALSALLRFVLRDQQYVASTCSALKTTCISVIEMDICIQYCYFGMFMLHTF